MCPATLDDVFRARRLTAPAAVAAAAVAVCGFVVWADPTTPGGVIPACPTKTLFGIDCPGCGGTRMLYSLLHLDISAALRFNAVGAIAVVLAVTGYTVWTWGRARGRPARLPRGKWIPVTALAVTVAWFVVRNIPVAPFTALRV
ncbi:DUF2752 domain-containing protein [Prescottella subtropica]|uniref:DUF2752 domain-containing protein n=1 Tax=Prescottella subtropica TaxID=2545757 RepID=UPI001F4F27EA|nr:DUF2752 domain-containing protein [Prescottella subtropica]